MERLTDYIGATLEWVQPKAMERSYELRSKEVLLASLAFRSAFGSLATAETAEESWTFKRVGFLNPRVTVRLAGHEEDLAVYHPKFWGDAGVLTFMDGAKLTWKSTNFWATEWVFTEGAGEMVMKFRTGLEKGKLSDIFKTQATIEVGELGKRHTRLALLACFGMYLIVLRQQDSAAVMAASAG